jgi:hypothetical protein
LLVLRRLPGGLDHDADPAQSDQPKGVDVPTMERLLGLAMRSISSGVWADFIAEVEQRLVAIFGASVVANRLPRFAFNSERSWTGSGLSCNQLGIQ